jgi:integrase/recombinase XerD
MNGREWLSRRMDEKRISGPARAMLYMTACGSGFRAHELSSLTPLSVNFDSSCILLERSVSKRRKYDKIEIHPSLAEPLRAFLADKPTDKPLWEGYWWYEGARMIRHDLKLAGVEPIDDKGTVVDFHALRTTFITNLVGTSSPLTLAQRISRLSTPTLLEMYYKPHDLARTEAINKMPSLVG